MALSRRRFLKMAGAAGAAGIVAPVATAEAAPSLSTDASAVLVDTTRCIGCRSCEAACAETHGLPGPEDDLVAGVVRTTGTARFTVVNAFASDPDGEVRFVKTQCNHCVAPACASACLVKAIEKTPGGPVVYHPELCLGCRYCMVACPFGVPKYEYERAIPYVRKCDFCAERQRAGAPPACVEACPAGALTFGRRGDLIDEAHARIYQAPDRYVHHVYGEHEVGGTSWLYLADRAFETLGFPAGLDETPYPSLTWPFLSAVPLVLTLWPPFLMGLYAVSRARAAQAAGPVTEEETRHE